MSLPSAFNGEMYKTSVLSSSSPASALRTSRSMQARNAASVFPEPVGAQISVVLSPRICGQPCSCGSVGVPNLETNHSRTRGCAHSRPVGDGTAKAVSLMICLQERKSCQTEYQYIVLQILCRCKKTPTCSFSTPPPPSIRDEPFRRSFTEQTPLNSES